MIELYKVYMPPDISAILKPVLEGGFITEGPKAALFEKRFQQWVGNPFIALTNSCTSAITIALRLAGVGPGDEVITSPMTCLATNEPILTVGASPVWCDIDPETGNIDHTKIEKLITSKTKAIMFVDWAGTPAELEEINKIAYAHGLKTIEDAAHAIGAYYKGKMVGNICDYTCFSFQAIKHLTTIDGGAIACKTEEDYKRAIRLRWFGMERRKGDSLTKWNDDVHEPGYKMHMNDINATIGLEQLKYIDANLAVHNANGNYLQKALKSINIMTTKVPDYVSSSYWLFTIQVDNRDEVSRLLTEAGIGNNITHTRNDTYSLFDKYKKELPGLDSFSTRMLNIPCGWWVSEKDREYIADVFMDKISPTHKKLGAACLR